MEGILSEKSDLGKKGTDHKIFFGVFLLCLVILSVLTLYFLKPATIDGDGISYVQSMDVLVMQHSFTGFVPNRLLTTFLGLESVIVLSKVFGSIKIAWIVLNLFFYFLITIIFYKLLATLFESEKTAFIGGLFLASNYALLVFGLNYLMDIGGWAFYMLSILYMYRYVQAEHRRDIILASCFAGIGGLFKEYALLATVVIAFFLIHDNRRSFYGLVRKSFLPALLTVIPLLLVYLFVYTQFHYTYLTWFGMNKTYYVYHSRIIEYIKSFGSLVTVLGLFFVGGLIVFWKERKELDHRLKLFIFSVCISIAPIFFWPAITQRILFITIPFVIIISCFFIKKYEKWWYFFLVPVALYALTSFFMNSVILTHVNLPF